MRGIYIRYVQSLHYTQYRTSISIMPSTHPKQKLQSMPGRSLTKTSNRTRMAHIHTASSPSYNPLVFSGSILTSSPLISFTDSNAGLPAYNCCCCRLDCASSTSWVTPSGLFPRNRLRISIIPRLEWQKDNVNGLVHFSLVRMGAGAGAGGAGDVTYLHSLNPFRSCWHFMGNSSASGELRHSRGEWRWTIIQSDSWRHCARASPAVLLVLLRASVVGFGGWSSRGKGRDRTY